MEAQHRNTGISVVGEMPWGTHFCHFYETTNDLMDTVVSYIKAGLEHHEFCMWVISDPVTEDAAWQALRHAVPGFDRLVEGGSVEIVRGHEWYLVDDRFDRGRVAAAWTAKLAGALARGFPGMCVSGNTSWLDRNNWDAFVEYEQQLNETIHGQPMTVLCTYALATNSASDLLDAARTHQFAIARRRGRWEVVETPQLRRARAEVERLASDLERRVADRTRELASTNEELRKEIAERKHAEGQFRLLAETIPQHVWSVSPDGSVNYLNQRWLNYTGLTREEADHGDWTLCLHPADVEPVTRAWREAWARGRPYEIEYRFRGADGAYRRFLSRAVPLRDEAGRIVQWSGTNTDIEEGKQAAEAEAELAHVTRLATLGELAVSLAHELSQPLAAVVGNAAACLRWLQRDEPALDEAVDAMECIVRDAHRASDVIVETPALLKKSNPTRTVFDIGELVRDVAALLGPDAQRHRVRVEMRCAEGIPAVRAARVQLQQVIVNLAMNGIEAMVDVDDRPRVRGYRGRLSSRARREAVRGVPHHESGRAGHGAAHQPLHHRGTRRAALDERQRPARIDLRVRRSRPASHGAELHRIDRFRDVEIEDGQPPGLTRRERYVWPRREERETALRHAPGRPPLAPRRRSARCRACHH
jgi:PAS domain S-box-containing protein